VDRQQAEAEYAAAMERAQAQGVSVVAEGYGVDGTRYWFTPSAAGGDAADWHRVWIAGGRFQCSCSGGQHGKVCMHKAVARARYLIEEGALQKAEAEQWTPPVEPRPFTVEYEAKRGRLSACSKCRAAFAAGERITLRGTGVAWCMLCSTEPTAPGADAPVHRTNSGFSIFKQE
jgi:hypothetical protein